MYYMTTCCFASHIFFPLLLFPIAGVKWCGAHLRARFESLGSVLCCALNYLPFKRTVFHCDLGREEAEVSQPYPPSASERTNGHGAVSWAQCIGLPPPIFHNNYLLLFSVSENLRRIRLPHILKSARYHFSICPKGHVPYQ